MHLNQPASYKPKDNLELRVLIRNHVPLIKFDYGKKLYEFENNDCTQKLLNEENLSFEKKRLEGKTQEDLRIDENNLKASLFELGLLAFANSLYRDLFPQPIYTGIKNNHKGTGSSTTHKNQPFMRKQYFELALGYMLEIHSRHPDDHDYRLDGKGSDHPGISEEYPDPELQDPNQDK